MNDIILSTQNGVQIGQNRLFSWMRERGYPYQRPQAQRLQHAHTAGRGAGPV